jgi:Ni/Co efflux regulator RcnB
MKPSALACAVAAALLAFGALAHADEHERGERHWVGERRGREGQQQRGWERQAAPPPGRGWRQQPRPDGPPPSVQQPYPQQRFERHGPPVYATPMPQPQYAPPPQYLPPPPPPQRWNHARGFRPGDALPPEYRQRQFIVRDWRAHRLYAPPPGYLWVQPEPGSYLLIGNNGVIANMLVGE